MLRPHTLLNLYRRVHDSADKSRCGRHSFPRLRLRVSGSRKHCFSRCTRPTIRSANLHFLEQYDGIIPQNVEQLLTSPGIGPYRFGWGPSQGIVAQLATGVTASTTRQPSIPQSPRPPDGRDYRRSGIGAAAISYPAAVPASLVNPVRSPCTIPTRGRCVGFLSLYSRRTELGRDEAITTLNSCLIKIVWVCSKSVEKKRRLSLSKPGRPAYAFDRLRLRLPECSTRFEHTQIVCPYRLDSRAEMVYEALVNPPAPQKRSTSRKFVVAAIWYSVSVAWSSVVVTRRFAGATLGAEPPNVRSARMIIRASKELANWLSLGYSV